MPQPVALDDPAPVAFARDYTTAIDDVSASGRYVVSRINTSGVDRFQTVVCPAGMRQSEFEKNNRLVLWEHGKDPTRGRLPVGRSTWIKYRGGGKDDLLAKTVFANDEYSQNLFELYRDELLRAWSINGKPGLERGAVGPPTAAELRARPDWAEAKIVYRAWDLTEYSAVTIAGNADALTEEVGRSLHAAIARGLWVPDAVRLRLPPIPAPVAKPSTPNLPPLVGRTLSQVQAAFDRRFDEAADLLIRKAAQDALDIARGAV